MDMLSRTGKVWVNAHFFGGKGHKKMCFFKQFNTLLESLKFLA